MKKIERLSCYIVALNDAVYFILDILRSYLLVGVRRHALNENLKRAAVALKKHNAKMFIFFHSRRSRPKKYYRKKPMCPNYHFKIV